MLDALRLAMFTACNAPTQLVHCAVGCAKAYSEISLSPDKTPLGEWRNINSKPKLRKATPRTRSVYKLSFKPRHRDADKLKFFSLCLDSNNL